MLFLVTTWPRAQEAALCWSPLQLTPINKEGKNHKGLATPPWQEPFCRRFWTSPGVYSSVSAPSSAAGDVQKRRAPPCAQDLFVFPQLREFNSSPLLRLWYQKIYQRNRENGKERVCGNSSYINTPSHSTSSQICPSGRLEGDLMALLELSSSVTLWCSSAGFEDVQLRLLSHCLFL